MSTFSSACLGLSSHIFAGQRKRQRLLLNLCAMGKACRLEPADQFRRQIKIGKWLVSEIRSVVH